MNYFLTGLIGALFATALASVLYLNAENDSMMYRKIGTQICQGVVYNVTVDSAATDSLHKIEWRKK